MTPTTSSTPSDAPQLPQELLPHDGRFGCGPSKIRPEQIKAIDQGATTIMGTSHRKPGVKNIVASIQEGLTSLFQLPDGYEIVASLGGATAFWDAATFGLIERRSAHLKYGEFSEPPGWTPRSSSKVILAPPLPRRNLTMSTRTLLRGHITRRRRGRWFPWSGRLVTRSSLSTRPRELVVYPSIFGMRMLTIFRRRNASRPMVACGSLR